GFLHDLAPGAGGGLVPEDVAGVFRAGAEVVEEFFEASLPFGRGGPGVRAFGAFEKSAQEEVANLGRIGIEGRAALGRREREMKILGREGEGVFADGGLGREL